MDSCYPKLHKALRFAVKAHKKQDRDGDSPLPYATHAIDVLNLVRLQADVKDEDVLCAAVLHDVVEQTGAGAQKIESRFGKDVATLVCELTREEPGPEADILSAEELWNLRNEMLMKEIDRMSNEAKIIKLADRLSNIGLNLKTRTGKKRERYVIQTREILQHIDRDICPPLWDSIEGMLSGAPASKADHKPHHNGSKRSPKSGRSGASLS